MKQFCLIRFVQRGRQRDYVNIIRGGGCYSQVGRTGNRQDISLGNGCATSVGTPIHEMMHAIGNISFTNINLFYEYEIMMKNGRLKDWTNHYTF